MTRVLVLLLGAVVAVARSPGVPGLARAQGAPTDSAAYAVVVRRSHGRRPRAPAVAALKQYRDASRKDDGYVRIELFEQVGRPGHFAIVETWRDQKALDARGRGAEAAAGRAPADPRQRLRSAALQDLDGRASAAAAEQPRGLGRLTRRRHAGSSCRRDAQTSWPRTAGRKKGTSGST